MLNEIKFNRIISHIKSRPATVQVQYFLWTTNLNWCSVQDRKNLKEFLVLVQKICSCRAVLLCWPKRSATLAKELIFMRKGRGRFRPQIGPRVNFSICRSYHWRIQGRGGGIGQLPTPWKFIVQSFYKIGTIAQSEKNLNSWFWEEDYDVILLCSALICPESVSSARAFYSVYSSLETWLIERKEESQQKTKHESNALLCH